MTDNVIVGNTATDKKKFNIKPKHRFSPIEIVLLVVLLIYVLSLFIVFGWGVMTSFKSAYDFSKNPAGFPREWAWNFQIVFDNFYITITTGTSQYDVSMIQMYGNSILYAIGCSITKTVVTCVTAYVCARYAFRLSKIIHTVIVITMFIPVIGSLISEMQLASALGLKGHIWGLWIMNANCLGLYFLVFYSAAKSLPASIFEAGKIDGASDMRLLISIAFPILRNLFFTVFLINFIQYWNDYQTPLIYIPNQPTISYGMYYLTFMSNESVMCSVPVKMATAILVTLPIIIIFIITNKRLLGNLTLGSDK